MEIDVVHRYSHMGEKLLRITYNALGVKLIVTLQVCNGCAQSKAKARAVSKKTYMRASQPGESVFGHKWSISGEFDWESVLHWCSRRLQPLSLEFIHKTQVATSE